MKPLSAIALSAFFLTATPAFSQDLPNGAGKDVVVKVCTSCHDADTFSSKRHSKEEWKSVVDTMIGYGAEVTDEQATIVVDYLTKNFGKSGFSAKINATNRQR